MSIKKTPVKEILCTLLLRFFSFHLLSRLISFLSRWENKAWKNLIIKKFGRRYRINTKEAVSRNLNHYPSFNHFFTRELKPGMRPITEIENGIASPADGIITQMGEISEGEIIQAKGQQFTVSALLGGDNKRAASFNQGFFTTIHLTPKDYHRIHMPLEGTLHETVHIPGNLLYAYKSNLEKVPEIYAKNERVICFFYTDTGPMALVLVGSIFSSSIETIWDGVITPSKHSEIRHWSYPFNPPTPRKGEEMGRFNFGSTVILLLGNDKVNGESHSTADSIIKMGELIGKSIV